MVHFFFEVPAFTAATLELDEELDDEDVLELELEESESEASEAPELVPTFSSSKFEAFVAPLWWYSRSHSPDEDCPSHLQCSCPATPDISHTH